MSNILEWFLALLGDVDYLKRTVDIIKNNEEVLNDFHNKDDAIQSTNTNEESQNWEDFIKEDEKNKTSNKITKMKKMFTILGAVYAS